MKSRRYVLIWLGLFLPTVAVGVLSVVLLARERNRLDEQVQASAGVQARTVADNIDLIMAEVKTGVSQALKAASGPGNESSRLAELALTNPYVDSTYVWGPREQRGEYEALFESSTPSVASLFVDLLNPPWSVEVSEREVRQDLSSSMPVLEEEESVELKVLADSYLKVQSRRQSIREVSQLNVDSLNSLKKNERARSELVEDFEPNDMETVLVPSSSAESVVDEGGRLKKVQDGWLMRRDGQIGWLAWSEVAKGGRVIGASLDVDAVRQELDSALPVLARNDQSTFTLVPPGRRKQESLYQNSFYEADLIPIGAELPGWTLQYSVPGASAGSQIFLTGVLFVAVFCAASLGAGALILLQSRKDASDAMKRSSFVSNVSHELRTPLTTIRMYSEMLADGRVKDDRRTQYLDTISGESQRLTRLVDNVLDFSHLEQSKKHYNKFPFDIVELVESVVSGMAHRAEAVGVEVVWDALGNPVSIVSDRDAVEQILINLYDNALKYGSSGKVVEIGLTLFQKEVEIRISDRGPGISKTDSTRIFKAFERLDQSLTASQAGSGLGLSICAGLARDLGAQLVLDQTVVVGASFVVTLSVE